MTPAAAAALPPAIRPTPKTRRWRYSYGTIRRCMPVRGGDRHHPRRPLAAVLSLAAFIGMPPVCCGAGHPITYQRDITLIGSLSMVAVLTGRLGDGASARVTYPAPMRSSSRIRCTHALNERQVREDLGQVPKVTAGVRFYLPGVQQQRAGVGRELLAQSH